MTVEEMRTAIIKVYQRGKTGLGWKKKVEAMSESQVIAVYLAFEKNGTFRRNYKKHNKQFFNKQADKVQSRGLGYEVKQLTIDDILTGNNYERK